MGREHDRVVPHRGADDGNGAADDGLQSAGNDVDGLSVETGDLAGVVLGLGGQRGQCLCVESLACRRWLFGVRFFSQLSPLLAIEQQPLRFDGDHAEGAAFAPQRLEKLFDLILHRGRLEDGQCSADRLNGTRAADFVPRGGFHDV